LVEGCDSLLFWYLKSAYVVMGSRPSCARIQCPETPESRQNESSEDPFLVFFFFFFVITLQVLPKRLFLRLLNLFLKQTVAATPVND